MLKQYKKIAVIERDDRVALNESWKTSRINISLAFNPSRLLVLCYSFRGDNYIIVDSQKNNTEATATKGTNSLIYINNVTSNGFTIGARSTYDGQTIAIRQIIAIG